MWRLPWTSQDHLSWLSHLLPRRWIADWCPKSVVSLFWSILRWCWVGNFFHGFHAGINKNSVGFLTMVIPLYQAELAHPSIRGRVTALQQFMLGVGALIAAWISYGTYVGFAPTDSAQWRVSLGLQIIPAVFLGLLIGLFPEVFETNNISYIACH